MVTGVWQKSGFIAKIKLCASYQVQCWQTVQYFEIRFFAKRQTVVCYFMTDLITKDKLKVFSSYGGDIDGLLRIDKSADIGTFGKNLDRDWGLISSKLQDLDLISRRLASYDFTKQALTELEEITDEESFQILTNKINFYCDFQNVRQILEHIKSWTTSETDTVWAGYDNGEDFLVDLNQDIEKIKFCDFATLDKLEMEFAPTSTYQEISLSNGWGDNFLKLAEDFDSLHKKITTNNYEADKKQWWKFW